MPKPMTSLLFLFLLLLSFLNVNFAIADDLKAKESPFSPKAYLIRYWNKQINSKSPTSSFLLSKASPLNAVEASTFTKLAAQNTLSSVLPSFCFSAKLFCFPDASPSLKENSADTNFAVYQEDKNFTSYGTGKNGGVNSFKHYSDNGGEPTDNFRQYSGGSANQKDKFSSYGSNANTVLQTFHTYGDSATGGSGDFKNYTLDSNLMNIRFNKYSGDSHGRTQSFSSYNNNTNAGREWFTSYGKNGDGTKNEFVGYTNGTNFMESNFKGYSESGQGAIDTFASYSENGNVPRNNFKSYGEGGVDGVESFKNYTLFSGSVNSFETYDRDMNSGKVNFANYEYPIANTNDFSRYGQGATKTSVGFKNYDEDPSFKDYAKNGTAVTFATYAGNTSHMQHSGSSINKQVEPGKFFREFMLKEGTVMPMPDIRDKMPVRTFLPRAIVSKLPFSTSQMSSMKEVFHASDDSVMEHIIKDALSDCERAPSPGETKRCVESAEDMIDFAVSVLGHDVALRTTENTKGSKQNILIGSVKGIDGGRVTKSVSCHQSLYPYLLYYCHSVPKVRVYEADIFDRKSKKKINHGVAICHLDTSAWSEGHGAFVALGSGPGRIEVCHWIFENDLTWTIADH